MVDKISKITIKYNIRHPLFLPIVLVVLAVASRGSFRAFRACSYRIGSQEISMYENGSRGKRHLDRTSSPPEGEGHVQLTPGREKNTHHASSIDCKHRTASTPLYLRRIPAYTEFLSLSR